MNTVLVVGRGSHDSASMIAALTHRGYEVISVADARQAVEAAAKERPVLILLGVTKPKGAGEEICRDLKSAPETRDVPLILLSSDDPPPALFWDSPVVETTSS